MKTVAIIQARTGSSRLPGKVLMPLGDMPMILHILKRTAQSRVDAVLLATSREQEDDQLAACVRDHGFAVSRGSLEDVLDRYQQAAQASAASRIVRITGDCPLVDPEIIDACLERFARADCDYVSNAYPAPSYPDGLDVEVFSAEALGKAWENARKPSEREHVTPHIWNNPGLFRLCSIQAAKNLSHLRWTVDEPKDMEFMRQIFQRIEPQAARMRDILALLEQQPALASINTAISRNEGYQKSLLADAQSAEENR